MGGFSALYIYIYICYQLYENPPFTIKEILNLMFKLSMLTFGCLYLFTFVDLFIDFNTVNFLKLSLLDFGPFKTIFCIVFQILGHAEHGCGWVRGGEGWFAVGEWVRWEVALDTLVNI